MVEIDGLTDGLLDGKGAGAQVLELADIITLRLGRSEKGVQILDLLLAYVEQAAATGRT